MALQVFIQFCHKSFKHFDTKRILPFVQLLPCSIIEQNVGTTRFAIKIIIDLTIFRARTSVKQSNQTSLFCYINSNSVSPIVSTPLSLAEIRFAGYEILVRYAARDYLRARSHSCEIYAIVNHPRTIKRYRDA